MEALEKLNHGEMYEDLWEKKKPKSPYSLTTRIEAGVKYTWYRISPFKIVGRAWSNAFCRISHLPESELRTLDSFLKQVQEEKAEAAALEKRWSYYGRLS
jgi:hypothetical protein